MRKRHSAECPFSFGFVWASVPFVCLCWRSAAEQRVRKLLGAEGLQILDLLAHADEVNRNRPLPRDCRENAALRRAVELGDDEAGEAERVVESLDLCERVLPGIG